MEMNKKNASSSKCADCGKKTNSVATQEWVIDYRWNNKDWKPGDTIREYLCLNCGDKVYRAKIADEQEKSKRHREQIESNAKKTANECFTELNKLNEEFDGKIENEDLNAQDYKKFLNLKTKTNKLIRIKGTEKWDDYWMAEADFKLLKENLEKMEEKVKENTPPRTIDIANKGKYSKIRECSHTKGIEPCTDNPNFFCCSYCWETNSPEFLKRLKRWHADNLNKILDEHNITSVEFCGISNNYRRLLSDFTTQEEINSVYQNAEQDLQTYLKEKKGISITTSRERERERERENQKLTQQTQLRTQIQHLEQKSTKTPQEEMELTSKKQELKELEKKLAELENQKNQNQKPKNSGLGWKIGVGVLVGVSLVGLVTVMVRSRRNRKY